MGKQRIGTCGYCVWHTGPVLALEIWTLSTTTKSVCQRLRRSSPPSIVSFILNTPSSCVYNQTIFFKKNIMFLSICNYTEELSAASFLLKGTIIGLKTKPTRIRCGVDVVEKCREVF
jgi:hypothetical protein